ncbi:hypothetical protein CDV31_016897 [Fusarium ambrosium]|uniref:Uncharacterized protein n=1 Tax=Fusarium ambrosium TaxID=131363 RepID=A0A428RZ61_9HYPO|nr:hypothetical protein CDV31_016897 [Fusarium ambrosium]
MAPPGNLVTTTPATQLQEPALPQPTTDPRSLVLDQSLMAAPKVDKTTHQEAVDMTQRSVMTIQPPAYPLEEIQEEFDLQHADEWLAGLADDYNEGWLRDVVETKRSPPTSLGSLCPPS